MPPDGEGPAPHRKQKPIDSLLVSLLKFRPITKPYSPFQMKLKPFYWRHSHANKEKATPKDI